MSALAERWRRAVASVADAHMRTRYVRSELIAGTTGEVAGALERLCNDAEGGDATALDVIAAAAPALAEPDLDARLDEIRAAAAELALPAVARLLRRRPRLVEEDDGQPDAREAPPVAPKPGTRPLTLGERKALARRPSRRTLDALMRDPHPDVIRNLLANPRLTEDDVVRIAARRPGNAEALTEIARHPRWALRARVRCALVRNPATPAAVAQPIVALLRRADLAELAEAGDVSRALREAAAELLARRPPRDGESPGSGDAEAPGGGDGEAPNPADSG